MKEDLKTVARVVAVCIVGPVGVGVGTFMAMWLSAMHPHKAEKWPGNLTQEFAASQCRVANKCPAPHVPTIWDVRPRGRLTGL